MEETVSFKVHLKNSGENADSEVRRFAMDREVSTNFSTLMKKLSTIFPLLDTKTFALSWIDDESDSITISTDDELAIALSEMSGPVYKLNVQVTGEKEGSVGGNTDGEVHPGITCDGCEKDLAGFRYKCIACPDFDLCGVCESAGLHPQHKMIRISRPGQNFPPKLGRPMAGKRGRCHVPMPGHMAGRQRNSCVRPCHVAVPGIFGFLEGLEKAAGGHGNFGKCSREEKSCNETNNTDKKGDIETNHEEVRKENDENKVNGDKSSNEKMVEDILETDVVCLGDDVQVPSADNENVAKDIIKEDEVPTEGTNYVEPENQKTTSSNADDEEWTILKDDSLDEIPPSNIYPALHEVTLASSSETDPSFSSFHQHSSVYSSPPDDISTPCSPSAPANVTDTKILTALQAMINMGFTNEGGWLENLLEAKEGDIGKVLDVIKPNKK